MAPFQGCSILDPPVESDYTVVFFAAGGKHTPGWNWVWKAYRSLSRKYRKNLKRLVRHVLFYLLQKVDPRLKYIVHSSFFSKSAPALVLSYPYSPLT
jgi:Rho GTPase-activating protein 1